jgi:hypothetical protein
MKVSGSGDLPPAARGEAARSGDFQSQGALPAKPHCWRSRTLLKDGRCAGRGRSAIANRRSMGERALIASRDLRERPSTYDSLELFLTRIDMPFDPNQPQAGELIDAVKG